MGYLLTPAARRDHFPTRRLKIIRRKFPSSSVPLVGRARTANFAMQWRILSSVVKFFGRQRCALTGPAGVLSRRWTRIGASVGGALYAAKSRASRSEEHTSELQSLMRISYAVFCLKKKQERHMKRDIANLKHK